MLIRYNDSELEQLLEDSESDLVEMKEDWKGDAPKKVRQAVCAFANDLPDHRKPGVLFIGVKDDRTPARIKITNQLLLTLSDIKTDGNILPPPSIQVEKRVIRGTDIAVVTTQPSYSTPVRYKGQIWIRIGSRRGIATPEEERILNEKRRYRDIPFDIQPVPSSDISALNKLLFYEEYLPKAFSSDILSANNRPYEQQLASCKLVACADDPTPTVLGLLIVGVQPRDWLPGVYVQFLRINGEKLTDEIVDEAEIDGTLVQIIRGIEEKLKSHNRIAIDVKSDSVEKREIQYPMVALEQIVRNAVMHRSYEGTNAPIRVYWFNDRIEIHSPGGPFGSVSIENFGQTGLTDYRNPNLAEAMNRLGFVQKYGIGIPIAQDELRRNGNPPAEFETTASYVLATIRRKL